jgi:hypothetical protein
MTIFVIIYHCRRESSVAVFTSREDADANCIELDDLGWDNLNHEEHE